MKLEISSQKKKKNSPEKLQKSYKCKETGQYTY